MKIVTRKSAIIGSVTAITLLIFLLWSARLAWLATHEISSLHAERIFQKDDFPDNARAMLLRMNNLLLIREFRASQTEANRPRFEALAEELRAGFENEESILPENVKRGAVRQIKHDFEDYLDAAYSFMDASREGISLETRLERIQLIREKAERIIITLNQISDSRAQEIESTFSEYKASQNRLYRLVLFLAVLAFSLVGAAVFITLQKRVATLRLELAQSKLSQEKQERLASLGILASGVAHEIRNPLTAIKARLFALAKKVSHEPEAQTQIDQIGNEINRLEKIIKEFLLFARPPKPDAISFDIAPLLEQVGDFLSEELEGRGLRLDILPNEHLTAKGDTEQLKQILINLIQNAADASKENDVITLSTRVLEDDTNGQRSLVAIDVIDQGSGIPEEISKKLFTPFFTTKPKGSGLGLSIAKRIAQTHQGDLIFQSTEGQGTTFSLILPTADD